MNTPNPLIPQGSMLELQSKANVRVAVFTILAIHLVLLSGLLMLGCKGKKTAEQEPVETNDFLADIPPFTSEVGLPPPEPEFPVEPTNDVSSVRTTGVYETIPPFPGTTGTLSRITEPERTETAPPGTTTTPTPRTPATREHTIVAGDTFSELAKRYNVTVKAIQDANPDADARRLQIGQVLKIPMPTASALVSGTPEASPGRQPDSGERIYVVKSGDTLTAIAREHNTTVRALRSVNNLETDRIRVGQKLKLPAPQSSSGTGSGGTRGYQTPLSPPGV
ncbi:MAG TPA: LysM peptidoglycan-binding domain-containing protein [Methylomirabilota bacterium]|nr:LysM peptidoglycan-binding domain-containing protein [Methylomirabilota bacterium]